MALPGPPAVNRPGCVLRPLLAGADGLVAGLRGNRLRDQPLMDNRFRVLMSISDGSVLAVMADATCDVGLVGYELALLVSRTEATLTPQLVSEMRARLPVMGPTRTTVAG